MFSVADRSAYRYGRELVGYLKKADNLNLLLVSIQTKIIVKQVEPLLFKLNIIFQIVGLNAQFTKRIK